MKLGVMKVFTFLISAIFLLNFVSAVDQQTCNVVPRAQCIEKSGDPLTEGYIVMGMSAATNTHGQVYSSTPAYDYVLCCNFGTGIRTCDPMKSNKILGLSASTNAHAEKKMSTPSYLTDICYEEMVCDLKPNCISETEAAILSLSTDSTNAHIGAPADYVNKLCCLNASMTIVLPCTLSSAVWGDGATSPIVAQGDVVGLKIAGTGACNTRKAYLTLWQDQLIDSQITTTPSPLEITFAGSTAATTWTTPADSQGNAYYFRASLLSQMGNSIKSENLNIITPNYCADNGIESCNSYDEAHCNQRKIVDGQSVDLCNTAPGLNANHELTPLDCSPTTPCNCVWSTQYNKCLFRQETGVSAGNCGDDSINSPNGNKLNEECDVNKLNTASPQFDSEYSTCTQLNTADITYTGGNPKCTACALNKDSCTASSTKSCQDNSINQLSEICDKGDMGLLGDDCQTLGYDSGTLACKTGECQLDKASCANEAKAYCGDGICQATETCLTCSHDCGNCGGAYCGDKSCTSGSEACGTCYADCSGPCTSASCGDGICSSTETNTGCPSDCAGTGAYCGDNHCNGNEACGTCSKDCGACLGAGDGATVTVSAVDANGGITTLTPTDLGAGYVIGDQLVVISDTGSGAILNVKTISESGKIATLEIVESGLGYETGVAVLEEQRNTYCGDGIVSTNAADFEEQCDPSDGVGIGGTAVFNSKMNNCDDFALGTTPLTCNSDCTLNYASCTGTKSCGNGAVDLYSDECDGSDLKGRTCRFLGYYSGELGCTTSTCKLDYSNCNGGNVGTSESYIYLTTVKTTCDQGDGKKTIELTKLDESGTPVGTPELKTYPCPSYIKLPFFDYFQMLVTVIVIAAIYLFISHKKSKK